MSRLLDIQDLHVTFRSDEGLVRAVNGVSLSVNPGETLGVVGESGCGKSVTALAVMGLIPTPPGTVEQGKILFEGDDLLELSEKEYRQVRGNRISMIFQEPMTSLNPLHRIGRQIEESLVIHRKASRKKAPKIAVSLLEKVRIPDPARRARDFPHQLSGGMRQRVMIAMALSCAPRLLIADEPTTALDVTIQAQILDLMNELKQDFNTSIMLITHDLGVVAETADTVVVMYAGRVIESCDVKTMFTHPLHPYTVGLMESVPQLDRPVPENKMLKAIPGMVPSLTDLPPGCPFCDRCVHAFNPCHDTVPHLKDSGAGHFVRCFLHEK